MKITTLHNHDYLPIKLVLPKNHLMTTKTTQKGQSKNMSTKMSNTATTCKFQSFRSLRGYDCTDSQRDSKNANF